MKDIPLMKESKLREKITMYGNAYGRMKKNKLSLMDICNEHWYVRLKASH